MQRSEVKKGAKLVMSRGGRGAKVIVLVNRVSTKTAQVTTLEEYNSHPKGSKFRAPYALLEPLPDNGNKDEVEITGRPKVDIIVGQTTFRANYADSNALWKVIAKQGRNYLCAIQDEPIEIDGKTYPGDWAGTKKVFRPEEISQAIGMAELFDGIADAHEAFYKALTTGQIIHYHNGFNQWIRCEVVSENGKNVLKPIALVGDWKSYDLPRRSPDGIIQNGYHAKMILEGKTFEPHASNLYENGYVDNGSPLSLVPISLKVPDMTESEAARARLWQKIGEIKKVVDDHATEDPQTILNRVTEILK